MDEVSGDAVADSVKDTIKAAGIIDSLFKPHYVFVFPTPSIVVICGFFLGFFSLIGI